MSILQRTRPDAPGISKRFWYVTLIIGIVLMGCSGGSYKIIKGNIRQSRNTIKGSYQSFSGDFFKAVRLNKGQTITLKSMSTTEEGSLFLVVVDPYGNSMFEISLQDDPKERKIGIDQTGRYKIKVVGEDHRGSFTITWQIE